MKLLITIILSVLLASCSTSNTIDGPYSASNKRIDNKLASEGKAELRIFREDAMLAKLAGANIFLNNVKILTINNASALTMSISPGKHNIYSKSDILDGNGGCGFDFVAEKGEVIYMSISPKASGALPILSILLNPVVCKYEITPVDSVLGEAQFAKLQKNKT